tara:strand:+ start:331 stop:588 length:258 start_codon:yes stop_codon:yes gene_type:complete
LSLNVKQVIVFCMTLDDWRNEQGWSKSLLARQLGVPQTITVTRWCHSIDDPRRSVPNSHYMQRIIDLTDGRVTPNSFYALANDRG